jgi:hypothetical protein
MTPSTTIKLAAVAALLAPLALLAGCQRKPAAEKAADAKAAAANASATTTGPAPIASPPRRKPGLWSQTVKMAEMSQTTRICLDATTEAKMSVFGQQATKDMCKVNHMSRGLDGSWAFVSVCDMGSGGKTTTTGVASGDFGSHYTMTADSVTSGASAPQMNGSHKMVLDAVWQGPCPAGFKPGDMELPGGMKINVLEMAGRK